MKAYWISFWEFVLIFFGMASVLMGFMEIFYITPQYWIVQSIFVLLFLLTGIALISAGLLFRRFIRHLDNVRLAKKLLEDKDE